MSSLLGDPAISLARLSVSQYHQMIAAGVLLDGDRLELFEGVLVDRVPRVRRTRFASLN